MIACVTITLLAPVAGFFTALYILLLWLGDGCISPEIESDLDPILGEQDKVAIYEVQTDLIAMPTHLKTADEMVDWMTKELPKLTAEMPNFRV